MTRAVRLWAPVAIYAGVIFYWSAQPEVPLPPGYADKPTHAIAYSVLGALVVRALAGGFGARVRLATALAGVALTTAYGISDEIHQTFVPGRVGDLRDVAADALGGAIGAVVCWAWGIIAPAPDAGTQARDSSPGSP